MAVACQCLIDWLFGVGNSASILLTFIMLAAQLTYFTMLLRLAISLTMLIFQYKADKSDSISFLTVAQERMIITRRRKSV